MATCKIANSVFIPTFAASFEICAVGPWVSVAEREAALARGNPAKGVLDFRFAIADLFLNRPLNPISEIHNPRSKYANPLRSF
jgi:hypothetical protein